MLLLAGCRDRDLPQAIWLSTGTGPAQVVYPRAIAYDAPRDQFVVVDRMARVQRIDRDGQFVAGWRMPDYMMGKPVGVSVGPDGNIYVPDTHYQRIMVYSPDGHLLRQWGAPGKEDGQFIFPTDVAFDDRGRVYVSEYGDHDRIQIFDMQGNYLAQFGQFGDGEAAFSRPQSIAIVGDTVYLADSCNHRIGVWKTDGRFVKNIGTVGTAAGEFRFPYGLDVSPDGKLLVTEFGNNRVQVIDPESGKSVLQWGRAGRQPGELAYPWAAVTDKRGRVVIVDAGNNRLQVLQRR
ncbi:MAG TPA: hypothetical protein PLD59_05580 [Tepidisphaeraceae bacterium]|nr:hypothetical protein [Tepidisphaeraceae bacterium]